MASFKDIRKFIVSCYAEDMLDDEEFFALYDFYSSKNPHFPYDSYPPFDFGEMDDSECLAQFRVHKRDIPSPANHRRTPDNLYCQQRSVSDEIEGLCMLLRRLSYPCRYGDMLPRFARPVSVLSMVTNTVLDYIDGTHGHRITQWNNTVMSPVQLQACANANQRKAHR